MRIRCCHHWFVPTFTDVPEVPVLSPPATSTTNPVMSLNWAATCWEAGIMPVVCQSTMARICLWLAEIKLQKEQKSFPPTWEHQLKVTFSPSRWEPEMMIVFTCRSASTVNGQKTMLDSCQWHYPDLDASQRQIHVLFRSAHQDLDQGTL